jgi:hypothetical protein
VPTDSATVIVSAVYEQQDDSEEQGVSSAMMQRDAADERLERTMVKNERDGGGFRAEYLKKIVRDRSLGQSIGSLYQFMTG